jgi:hypothetical protein
VLLVTRTPLVAGTYAARITQSKQADVAWSFLVDPNTQSSSSPTTTAPTTSPPTTTAPTTAPTTSAPPSSSPTSSSSTAPPVAEDPEVSISEVACSYGARATGSVSLAVTNPADGAGPATYAVAVGAGSADTGVVADGSGDSVLVTGLPGGSHLGSVDGSDGTSSAFPVDVPTCPGYQGVRVSIRKSPSHRVRVRLDNVRNSETTRFRVVLGGETTRHRVPATEVRTVGAPLHRVTRVRVYVGQHLVARARLHP